MSRYAKISPQKIREWIREGRGQGHGEQYKPWYKVQNVPSLGYAHRVLGWKTNRRHEFLSNLELFFFYLLEWALSVIDVREQFPLLPLDETVAIAKELGFKHPVVPGTHTLAVMTTDFLVDVRHNGSIKEYARTIKPSRALDSKRVLEKFEIERRFWLRRGVDWGVVTEHGIPTDFVKNVEWLHPYKDITNKLKIGSLDVTEAERIMSQLLRQGVGSEKSMAGPNSVFERRIRPIRAETEGEPGAVKCGAGGPLRAWRSKEWTRAQRGRPQDCARIEEWGIPTQAAAWRA
jgi:hypothetical protein